MLERVRGWLQSEATQILIALLTVIFMVYFGMPQQSCGGGGMRKGQQQPNALLSDVAGTSIYVNDLNLIYNRAFGGDDRNDDEGNQREQRQARSLRSMVLIHLFADRARDMGLRVSDEEFKDYIKDPHRNMEYRYFYGRSGEWNGPYYKAYVQNQLQVTIPEYERFKRQELLARKYLVLQSSQVAVPPYELEHDYKIANTNLNLEFVAFDRESLQEYVSVSDEDIESFMENNAEQIQTYYDDNKKEKYTEPERVRVRRVFITKPGQSASKDERKKAQSKWKEAKRRVLEDDEALASVAAEINPSFSAKKKGLMDWTTPNNLDQNIAKAIEGKDTGTVETIDAQHAYMIVKLEDRKTAKETPLSEVRGEIAETLLRQNQVDQLIDSATKQLQKAARSTDSLSAALDQVKKNSDKQIWKGLSVKETGDFTLEGQNVPSQLQGQLSGMNLGGGSWANIPKIGTSESLAATAYRELSSDQPVPDKVFEVEGTPYVVRLKSRSEPSSKDDKNKGPGIESIVQQRNEKRSELLGQWQGIFQMPQESYGPWIEKQLEEAIDSEEVTIYKDRSAVANLFAQSFEPAGDAQAPSGAKSEALKKLKQKLRQRKQESGGSQGGGGKTIKLNPKGEGGGSQGGGGKTIKVNPKGEGGGSESGESGGE